MSYIHRTKIYKSSSFLARIEQSVANVSSKPTDEFALVKAYYDHNLFDCELCGHKNCAYAFEVRNLQTKIILKVGSECIHHFEDKGVDINVAEALMKRVMKATNQAREELKRSLGEEAFDMLPEEDRKNIRWYQKETIIKNLAEEAYKLISKEDKRQLIVNAYMIIQAKELLKEMRYNRTVLSEEEIKMILDVGLGDKLEETKKIVESQSVHYKIADIESELKAYLSSATNIDNSVIDQFKSKFAQLDVNRDIQIESLVKSFEEKKKFSWLINYAGQNYFVQDIKRKYLQYGALSENQINAVKTAIESESRPDVEFESAITFLLNNNPSYFVTSVNNFWKSNKTVSVKQRAAIMKIYDKLNKIK